MIILNLPGMLFSSIRRFVPFASYTLKKICLFLSDKMKPTYLLKAFARLGSRDPHVRLIIAGRGAPGRRKELEAMCDALGVGTRVVLAGPVTEDEKARLFGGALFTCMPSRYEGWGITAIEAGAAGKAVVGTNIPGLADAIRHGETGLLVPPEDVGALSAAMCQLLDEPDTRRRLGAAGRRWAKRFTWDRIARDQERVYEQVCAKLEKGGE